MTNLAYPQGGTIAPERPLIEALNTKWHERALWVYMAVVAFHWVEHITQAVQIWGLGMARPESLGALGLAAPWLVKSEVLHFGFALLMIVGLFLLRPGFKGTALNWWTASLVIQTWHFVEHSVLQGQFILGANLFDSPVPTSLLQPFLARPELHLLYNAIVFIPMVVAAVIHTHDRTNNLACTCAK